MLIFWGIPQGILANSESSQELWQNDVDHCGLCGHLPHFLSAKICPPIFELYFYQVHCSCQILSRIAVCQKNWFCLHVIMMSHTSFRVNPECCEYLTVQCVWLYFISMSRKSLRVNAQSIVCLNIKELLARSRRHIWRLSDSNVIGTHNHLLLKQTLNHLVKLAKWLSCVVSIYWYGAFDCMLLLCHVRVLEWIYTQ